MQASTAVEPAIQRSGPRSLTSGSIVSRASSNFMLMTRSNARSRGSVQAFDQPRLVAASSRADSGWPLRCAWYQPAAARSAAL